MPKGQSHQSLGVNARVGPIACALPQTLASDWSIPHTLDALLSPAAEIPIPEPPGAGDEDARADSEVVATTAPRPVPARDIDEMPDTREDRHVAQHRAPIVPKSRRRTRPCASAMLSHRRRSRILPGRCRPQVPANCASLVTVRQLRVVAGTMSRRSKKPLLSAVRP